jgi:hypothetical protein
MLIRALNLVPVSWLCPLFQTLVVDLRIHLQGERARFPYLLSRGTLREAMECMQEALRVVHTPPIARLYARGRCYVCACPSMQYESG